MHYGQLMDLNVNGSKLTRADEDPILRIESFSIINLCDVSIKLIIAVHSANL